jgi:glycosyltransferase involved in cell wall biosynthesis
MVKRSICIISFSPIHRDGRVLRQIKYLAPYYDLVVLGYGPPHPQWHNSSSVSWTTLMRVKRLGLSSGIRWETLRNSVVGRAQPLLGHLFPSQFESWYWSHKQFRDALNLALNSQCDAILANDWEALPVAAEAAQRLDAQLVFDAHEYSPLQREDDFQWRLYRAPVIRYMLKAYATQIDASMTVAPLIARRYQQEYGLCPVVVMNVPEETHFSSKAISPENIRLVHHGGAASDRRLERMIETIALCDARYSLHFMLVPHTPGYISNLKSYAAKVAPGRVIFHDPVPSERITEEIAQYDIGFYILEPTSYNKAVALPNKFFDFIAAGLAVCIGPSRSMAELINTYRFGWVAPTFSPKDMAALLNGLSVAQISAMKLAAKEVARKRLTVEAEMRKLTGIFEDLW